jgi:hypothetical protein
VPVFVQKETQVTGHQDLRAALAKEVNAETVILDGELVVVDHLGEASLLTWCNGAIPRDTSPLIWSRSMGRT